MLHKNTDREIYVDLLYNYQSAVVKGLERNISCLYEARCQLLGLDSCEHVNATGLNPDLALPGSGLTNHWLNVLLQQLRLSEQGKHIPFCFQQV